MDEIMDSAYWKSLLRVWGNKLGIYVFWWLCASEQS